MRSGDYRHLITIDETPYYLDTDAGLVASPVVAHATRWAKYVPITGVEMFKFAQIGTEVSGKWELREYLETVTPKMHLVYGTRRFEIVAVLHDEQEHRWTTLTTRELS